MITRHGIKLPKRLTIDEMKIIANSDAPKPKKKYTYGEDKLQIDCRYWFDCQYPELKLLLHHSPNEGLLMKHDKDGAKRKAMGMRAGFPDFIFLHPNKFYPYLAIELKTKGNYQTPHQKEYQAAVEREGARYVVVRSLEEFMTVINEYLT